MSITTSFQTVDYKGNYIKANTIELARELSVDTTIVSNDTIFLYDDNATIRLGKFGSWTYTGSYEFHCRVWGFLNVKTKQGQFSTSWFYPNFNDSTGRWLVMSYLKVQKYEFKCYDFYYQTYPEQATVASTEPEITYQENSMKPLLTGHVQIKRNISVANNVLIGSSATYFALLSPCTSLIKLNADDTDPQPCYLVVRYNNGHDNFSETKILIKITDLNMILI